MLPTPNQIREKLLTQLDDKNEINESSVVEVVSVLENYPFTAAVLEETRIGKMVNDLRRKLKNEKLAKRLKQLVRRWQSLALSHTPPENGVPGKTVARLHFSPAISPSPKATHGATKVNPPQQKGTPKAPVHLAPQSTSPALQINRSGVSVGRKGTSAGTSSVNPASVKVQSQASPALTGGGRAPIPASGHVASPKVSGQVPSPAVPRYVSPQMTVQATSVGSRSGSPAFSKTKGPLSPVVSPSPIHSPAYLSNHESGTSSRQNSKRVSSKFKFRLKDADAGDLARGRTTPTSVHSENSQDRITEETDNGRQDSGDESSCSSRTSQSHSSYLPLSHSTDTALMNVNGNNSASSQRELSKANVSSRKRVRTDSPSPSETRKKPKTDAPSLSFSGQRPEKTVNGHRKSGKKTKTKTDALSFSSFSFFHLDNRASSPLSVSSLNDSCAIFPQSDTVIQEDSSSHLSAQTSGWPAREKLKGKVKTTEQLIQDLQKKNSSSNVGNNIITQLRTNQIEKERDVPESVLPPGIKPRNKRGKYGMKDVRLSVPSSEGMISKNELVERFLNTSEPLSSVDDFCLDTPPSPVPSAPKLEIGACTNSYSKDSFDGNFSTSRQDQPESAPKDENSMDAVSSPLPSTSQSAGTASALTLQEIYAQLPPVEDNIDWDSVAFYELPERTPVTAELVDHLHSDRLPGINGMYDINGDWTRWQDTITLQSCEGEPLHILPYVDLDN